MFANQFMIYNNSEHVCGQCTPGEVGWIGVKGSVPETFNVLIHKVKTSNNCQGFSFSNLLIFEQLVV